MTIKSRFEVNIIAQVGIKFGFMIVDRILDLRTFFFNAYMRIEYLILIQWNEK